MLDNLIVNIKTILPSASKATASAAPISHSNRCQHDDKFNSTASSNESAIAFLKYSSNCDDDAILNERTNRTMLHVVRSYFSQFYHNNKQRRPASEHTSDCDAIMLPRVYDCPDLQQFAWDPVEFKVKEKSIDDIDNVIDKFVRVIRVNDTNSPMRSAQFYVCEQIITILNLQQYSKNGYRMRKEEEIISIFIY